MIQFRGSVETFEQPAQSHDRDSAFPEQDQRCGKSGYRCRGSADEAVASQECR